MDLNITAVALRRLAIDSASAYERADVALRTELRPLFDDQEEMRDLNARLSN
jgi:hypothetical protein